MSDVLEPRGFDDDPYESRSDFDDALRTPEGFYQVWDHLVREDPERLGRIIQTELDELEKQLVKLPTWLELLCEQQEAAATPAKPEERSGNDG
jgi:hypothetical protein